MLPIILYAAIVAALLWFIHRWELHVHAQERAEGLSERHHGDAATQFAERHHVR